MITPLPARCLPLAAALLVLAGCVGASTADREAGQAALAGRPTATTAQARDAVDFAALAASTGFVRPLPGLDPKGQAAFVRGKRLFEKNFTPEDGLGPTYNNVSCRSCHGLPATGGGSPELLTLVNGDTRGATTPLAKVGGPVLQDKAIAGIPIENMPLETRHVSRRITPPTFGMGLIEAVPTAAITAQLAADPEKQALGIRGRANWEFDQIGRFGWKSQKGDMIEFTQQASQFEMGLSSPGRPAEPFPNIPLQKLSGPSHLNNPTTPWVKHFFNTKTQEWQRPLAAPDLTQAMVEDLAAFQRYQAPPPVLAPDATARLGREIFRRAGCTSCHTPAFTTGRNALGVPAGLTVPLYSDLLVHEMGEPLDDGIIMGLATGTEWRTMPLWGLRYRKRYLHDGRTDDLAEAIRWHRHGEGAATVARFEALSDADRVALMRFLETL